MGAHCWRLAWDTWVYRWWCQGECRCIVPRDGWTVLPTVVCPIHLRQLFSASNFTSSNLITMSLHSPIGFRLDSMPLPRCQSSVPRPHALPSSKTLPFRESAMFGCHPSLDSPCRVQWAARSPRMEGSLLLQVECGVPFRSSVPTGSIEPTLSTHTIP